jgi:hypothetical protein
MNAAGSPRALIPEWSHFVLIIRCCDRLKRAPRELFVCNQHEGVHHLHLCNAVDRSNHLVLSRVVVVCAQGVNVR